MKFLLLYLSLIVGFASQAQLDLQMESSDNYYRNESNPADWPYFHTKTLKAIKNIDVLPFLNGFISQADSNVILLLTSETCVACPLMKSVMDSIEKEYPQIKLLEFTNREVTNKSYYTKTRFIGSRPDIYDTLHGSGYPRTYFIKNGFVVEFKRGGLLDEEDIPLHVEQHAQIINRVFGLPTKTATPDYLDGPRPYKRDIYFNQNVEMEAIVEDFVTSEHTFDTCDTGLGYYRLCAIDGEKWFGKGWSLAPPKTQFVSLIFYLNGVAIPLETSGMYNVNKQLVSTKMFKLNTEGNTYILSASFSDGPAYYVAKWEIKDGVGRRVLLSNDEVDF
jgi:thiol-disulfide isomerase/thioredoxin